MNIAFWSSSPGKGCTTASMLAVACMAAWGRRQDTAVLPMQGHNGALLRAFISKSDEASVKTLADSGMDSLVRTLKEGVSDTSLVRDSAFSFCQGRLHAFTPTKNRNVQAYNDGFAAALPGMLTALGSAFDAAFLDCPAGMQPISGRVIEAADAVVICLPQSYDEVDALFSGFNFGAGKYFFLFGDYDAGSMCSVRNLQRSYRKLVTPKNSAVIPHCTEFNNAMNNSSVARFFAKNVKCVKGDPNYPFIRDTGAAVEKLLRFCGARIPGGGDVYGD